MNLLSFFQIWTSCPYSWNIYISPTWDAITLLNTLVLCLNHIYISCNKEPYECGNLWGLLLLEFALQFHSNPNCYSLVIKLCSFTKSSNVSSSGLDCKHHKSTNESAESLENKISAQMLMRFKWGHVMVMKMKIKIMKRVHTDKLTVVRRPMLFKASSISRDEHMCWSDLRNILRFSLNAELTCKFIELYCHSSGERAARARVDVWHYLRLQ